MYMHLPKTIISLPICVQVPSGKIAITQMYFTSQDSLNHTHKPYPPTVRHVLQTSV